MSQCKCISITSVRLQYCGAIVLQLLAVITYNKLLLHTIYFGNRYLVGQIY